MQWRRYNIIQEAIDDLRERGFVNNFILEEEDAMVCTETGVIFHPDDLKMVGNHHFPIPDSEDAQTLIYALVSKDGLKGLVIDTYDSYPDIDLLNFMEKVKIQVPQNEQIPFESRQEEPSPHKKSPPRSRLHLRKQKKDRNQQLSGEIQREGN